MIKPRKRARPAQGSLDGIDKLPDSEVEALWLEEAERRAGDIGSRAAVLIPGDDVARKARDLVRWRTKSRPCRA